MIDVLSERVVKTRKDHLCFACGRRFPARSIMHYQASKYNGDLQSLYICGTCNELFKKAYDDLYDDFDECFHGYCVIEALQNTEFGTPEKWLESLTEPKGANQ